MSRREPYRVIELSKGFVTIISTEDFRRVNRHSWYAHISAGNKKKPGKPYARAQINGKKVYLHRFITGAPDGTHVDHDNFMTLDNRRTNLKVMSPQENIKRKRNF